MAFDQEYKKRLADVVDYTVSFESELDTGEEIASVTVEAYKNVSLEERTFELSVGDTFLVSHSVADSLKKGKTVNFDANQGGEASITVKLGDWTEYTSEIIDPGDYGVDANNPQKVTFRAQNGDAGQTYFIIIVATTEFGRVYDKRVSLYIRTD